VNWIIVLCSERLSTIIAGVHAAIDVITGKSDSSCSLVKAMTRIIFWSAGYRVICVLISFAAQHRHGVD
jgi:hypothetical protein